MLKLHLLDLTPSTFFIFIHFNNIDQLTPSMETHKQFIWPDPVGMPNVPYIVSFIFTGKIIQRVLVELVVLWVAMMMFHPWA